MSAELAGCGLACCSRCRRILLAQHLAKGRCKSGNDCGAHLMMRLAWEAGDPDAIAGAKAIERGLLEAAGVLVGEDGISEGTRAMADSFALMI